MNKPAIKPHWIRTSEIGSFAESTIKTRKPEIIRRILRENEWPKNIRESLQEFLTEITEGRKPNRLMEGTSDQIYWNEKLTELHPVSWFDLPWYFAEAFFYRRVLEATGYYQQNTAGFLCDPFQVQKTNQMESDLKSFSNSLWLFNSEDEQRNLDRLILAALWGNRADLSHMDIDLSSPALDLEGGDHLEMLINNLPDIHAFFETQPKAVAYLTDNVGREMYSDLALIEFLLSTHRVGNITMFVKPAPLFVSDVMRKDVELSLHFISEANEEILGTFVERIQKLVAAGRLVVCEEPSLCGYQMYDEMPFDFYRNLGTFDLAIIKGDANYRRVMGDRHWDFTQPIRGIVGYFPTSLLLLRTLKSEMIVDLTQEQVDILNRKYENWLVKGFCGVVQLVEKNEDRHNE